MRLQLTAISAAFAIAFATGAPPAQAQQDAPLKVTLAGGSVGGAWSAIGNAIGESIRRQAPGTAFSYEPGRDAANVQLVSTGRAQLGIAHAQIALRAIRRSRIVGVRIRSTYVAPSSTYRTGYRSWLAS